MVRFWGDTGAPRLTLGASALTDWSLGVITVEATMTGTTIVEIPMTGDTVPGTTMQPLWLVAPRCVPWMTFACR